MAPGGIVIPLPGERKSLGIYPSGALFEVLISTALAADMPSTKMPRPMKNASDQILLEPSLTITFPFGLFPRINPSPFSLVYAGFPKNAKQPKTEKFFSLPTIECCNFLNTKDKKLKVGYILYSSASSKTI
jgi:hypothetical protein